MKRSEYQEIKNRIIGTFKRDMDALERVYSWSKESEVPVEKKRKRGRPPKKREPGNTAIGQDEIEAYVKDHAAN